MWGALSSCIADTLGCCAFHFSFAVSSTITEKIISQENEKKKKGFSDSPHWTAEQELDGVAISFIFSVAPCSSGYVHANTALQRCLITASWVPEMQTEGRPWGCTVLHGESLMP